MGIAVALQVFFFQQPQEFPRLLELRQPLRDVRLLGELRDLAQDREILVRYFEGRSDDQEQVVNRPVVDGFEVDPVRLSAKRDPKPGHDQRPAVGDGDAAADTGRPRFSRRFSILYSMASDFSSSASRAIISRSTSSFAVLSSWSLIASAEKNSLNRMDSSGKARGNVMNPGAGLSNREIAGS